MARLCDYEGVDFVTIDNGIIIWNGFFYDSDGYIALTEYSKFYMSIDEFINKYNRDPEQAYELYGSQFTQYLTKEGEDENTRESMYDLLDSWVNDATPLAPGDITMNTPNGFYVLRENKISIVREYTSYDNITWYLLENNGRACFSRDKTTDPATLPYIEYTDPVLQDMYHCLITSDNDMWFVDTDPWNEFGITQEEFENRIDAMVDKYSLEDVITKNEDEALYTCYGDLQSRFSWEV